MIWERCPKAMVGKTAKDGHRGVNDFREWTCVLARARSPQLQPVPTSTGCCMSGQSRSVTGAVYPLHSHEKTVPRATVMGSKLSAPIKSQSS